MAEYQKSDREKILFKREVSLIKDLDLWESSACKQQVMVSRDTTGIFQPNSMMSTILCWLLQALIPIH